jgi:ABC-2 type transport system ATP-binding protein
MIRCEGLTKQFGPVTAVDHLNLTIDEGEIFGLVGPDGAGKTTTLRLLTGILERSAGQASISGYAMGKDDEKIKDMIAYMPQRFGLYEDLTVMENLRFYADVYCTSRRDQEERITKLLAFTRMEPFRKRLGRNLSGGMKQKLGLACALIHTPKVLLLDEPTNGVDPVSRRDFWNILYELLREKVTILFSTSYLDEAERCSRIGLLYHGKLLRCDHPDRIIHERQSQTLEQAFISIIQEQNHGNPS